MKENNINNSSRVIKKLKNNNAYSLCIDLSLDFKIWNQRKKMWHFIWHQIVDVTAHYRTCSDLTCVLLTMRQYNVNIWLTNAIFFMFSRYPHFFRVKSKKMCYKTGQLRRILSILLLHRVALYCSEGRATAASHIHHTSQPWRKTPSPHGRCRKWMRKIGWRTTTPSSRIHSGGLTLIGQCVIHRVTWLGEKSWLLRCTTLIWQVGEPNY